MATNFHSTLVSTLQVSESVNTLRFAESVNRVQLGTGKLKE